MRSQIRACVVSVLALGVLGCEGSLFNDGARALMGHGQWDGRWVGRFESSLGLFSCPTRGTMEFRLANGVVSGTAAAEGVGNALEGYMGADGAVLKGFMKNGARAVATLTGTFGEKSAAGRWVGEVCEGTWTVWKLNRPG
jgi:hypothetical protein